MHKSRLWIVIVASAACLLLVCEIILRLVGFGDPQQVVLDGSVEYYGKEGVYHRFGNRIRINRAHLRGKKVSEKKEGYRVMLLGDSIVHGTFRLDQDELISVELEEKLSERSGVKVEVLNVAAVSWGPANQGAFLKKFGLFDSDQVVWIVSTHDLYDAPIPGYARTLPTSRPFSALQDAAWVGWRKIASKYIFEVPPDSEQQTLSGIDLVLSILTQKQVPLIVAFHLTRQELDKGTGSDADRLAAYFRQRNIEVLTLKEPLEKAQSNGGGYADYIHLNRRGAKRVGGWLANQLLKTKTISNNHVK